MYDILSIANDIVSVAKSAGVSSDVQISRSENRECTYRMGSVEKEEDSVSFSISLRVISGKKQSFVSSNNIVNITDKEVINYLVDRAIDMAKSSPDDPYIGLEKSDLSLTRDKSSFVIPESKWLTDQASAIEKKCLENSLVSNSEGVSVGGVKTDIAYSNSFGDNGVDSRSNVYYSAQVVAGKDLDMQSEWNYFSAVDIDHLPDVDKFSAELSDKVILKLNPQKIDTDNMPVIFDARIASRLLSSFASCCKGAAIAEKHSFLMNDMGNKLFDESINIIDNPLMESGVASRYFDGEGMSTKAINLVKDGHIANWLLDLRSARRLSLPTNANAVRSGAGIYSSSSNLYLNPGDISPEELISSVDNGIYITDVFGHGINELTGDYSQGAAGFLIKDGKKTDISVNNITIAGNMRNMFRDMKVANDLIFNSSVNAPTIFVGNMMVACS